ncbi:hypothetical protein [Glutamicibacter nicotianae]|nr:hypothetical protein [Glutamicibacter nicotianae]MBM7766601.1 gamma-glutamyl:cysteine ligase YbdK (ATP-grasp superfamily) [Glutamicibacter nicotianae]
MNRTFGIEEEFFVVDPATAAPVPMSDPLPAAWPGTAGHHGPP